MRNSQPKRRERGQVDRANGRRVVSISDPEIVAMIHAEQARLQLKTATKAAASMIRRARYAAAGV